MNTKGEFGGLSLTNINVQLMVSFHEMLFKMSIDELELGDYIYYPL
jgi:hypothetical protein